MKKRSDNKVVLVDQIQVLETKGGSIKLQVPKYGEGWVPRARICWTSPTQAYLMGWIIRKCLVPLAKSSQQLVLL